MAEAPKPQRQRRNRRQGNNTEIVEINIDTHDKGNVPAAGRQVRSRRRVNRRRRTRRPVFGPWLPGQAPRSRLRRAIKREIKREGLEGPRVSVQQRVSSTFGLVGPNKSGNVELELNFFLHPSLAKEANDGTSFGPVQALAAQYALWKLKYLRLTFTPMVGASAVSGTVVRASLNLSQSPGGTNWSGLGTRIHMDMHPGQTTTFHLRGDQIGGPRDGGWWLTDTNEEGNQSAGPIVEVHTLGKTMSTFKDKEWDSPLFIVEGLGVWQFANYQVKPALGMLERKQAKVDVGMTADAGQPITMELPVSSAVTQFMLDAEPETASIPAIPSVGETIFQIVDVGADLATRFTPPPFSWLISGGWWFLKRAFGKTRASNAVQFYVYPSLADAQNDRPAIAGQNSTTSTEKVNAELIVTQINAPNVGPQPTATGYARAAVPVPIQGTKFRVHSQMFPMESINFKTAKNTYPTCWIIGRLVNYTNDQRKQYQYIKTNWWIAKNLYAAIAHEPDTAGSYVHTVYKLLKPRFSDQTGNIENIPPSPASGAALFHANNTETNYKKIGDVVATASIAPGNSEFLGMVLTLVKTTTQIASAQLSGQTFIRLSQTGNNQGLRFKKAEGAEDPGTNTIHTLAIQQDEYLLCVAFAGEKVPSGQQPIGYPAIAKLVGTNVDIAVTLPFTTSGGVIQSEEFARLDYLQNFAIEPYGVPYGLSGQLMPAYSIDQLLDLVTPQNTELYDQLVALGFLPKPQLPDPEETSESDDEPPVDFYPDSSDDDLDLQDILKLLLDAGRLPNSAEIAYRKGEYEEAYRLYKDM